jgi:hypothetical protein
MILTEVLLDSLLIMYVIKHGVQENKHTDNFALVNYY